MMTQNAAYAALIFSVISIIQEKMKTSYNPFWARPDHVVWWDQVYSWTNDGPWLSVPEQVK